MIYPSFWKNIETRIVAYSDEQAEALEYFCDSECALDPRADENIRWTSLSRLLNVEKRFQSGQFFLFYAEDQIVAMSGYHQSDFDPNTYVCGVRTYTSGRYQFKGVQINFLFPLQLRLIQAAKARQALMVFNKHNEKLFRYMQRAKRFIDDSDLKALEFKALPHMIRYKNTNQFGIVISFDPSYQYSFEGMRADATNI